MLDYLSIIIDLLPSIIGISAAVWAKQTLDHSKRSSLLKDRYEPILAEIKLNENIEFESSELFSFKYLKELKDTYLYYALSKKERKSVDGLIKMSEEVNSYKNDAPKIAENSIMSVINNDLEKQNSEKLLGEIYIVNKNTGGKDYGSHFKLLDFLTSKDLYSTFVMQNFVLFCEYGDYGTLYYGEDKDIEIEEFIRESAIVLPLEEIIMKIVKKPEPDSSYKFNYVIHYFTKSQNDMLTLFKKQSSFSSNEQEFNRLKLEMESFKKGIHNKITKLLIPNYCIKKLFRMY